MRAKRCDQCGAYDVVDRDAKPVDWYDGALPKNWIFVQCFDNERDGGQPNMRSVKVNGEFCSFACASRYLAAESTARQ